MLILRKLLPTVLILQLALGQLFTSSRVHAEINSNQDENLSSEQQNLIRASVELEAADENDLPKSSKDAFLLTEQHLTTSSGVSAGTNFDLSSLDLNLPEFMVTDLEKEVAVGIDQASGSLMFTLTHGTTEVAKHVISKAKPIAFAQDKELLVFLDQSGTYYAIDMGFAKTALFRSPLPVIELLKSKVDLSKIGGKISLQFLQRSQKPYSPNEQSDAGVFPLDQSGPQKVMRAGDLVVTSEKSNDAAPSLIEELSRKVIRTQLYSAETVIAFLALRLNPEQFDIEIAKLKALPNATDVLSTATESVDPFVKAAILAIPSDAMAALKSRAQVNLNRTDERVDQFSFQEWQSHQEALLKKIQAEQSANEASEKLNFNEKQKSVSPQNLIYRYLTPKTLKIMAAITLGGASVYGASQLLGGNGPVWAVHWVNEIYNQYLPSVLKDAAYRVTLLKSSIALGAFIPLLWGIGFIGTKKSGKGWKPAKMIASMGMKVYAAIQLPFYHRLAALTKQGSFLKAMRL